MLSSSPSCRILTVATTLERAVNLVEQIQALAPTTQTEVTKDGDGKFIPWTISNRYYSADVHFLARQIKGLTPYHIQEVPAVIFTWNKGNTYKHHILRLAQDLKGHEPEVSLAVRLPCSDSNDQTKAEEEDDDEKAEDEADTDEFLSEHGFEFIDIDSTSAKNRDSVREGIPSLPRVLDALSTIMWPSMQTSARSKSRSNANPRTGASLDWAQSSSDDFDLSSDPDLLVTGTSAGGPLSIIRQQKNLDVLARWLEEGDDTRNDPWKLANEVVDSPTVDNDELTDHFDSVDAPTPRPAFDRFDDDFTVFVSAPATEAGGNAPDGSLSETAHDTEKLTPSFSGVMYHSLGSQPDLYDQDVKVNRLEHSDDDSDGLPSEDEVRKSAELIFGPSFAGPSFSQLSDDPNAQDQYEPLGDDNEIAPFDLSQVFSALQGMKDEITGIHDEQERRRAAARIALGFAYGLEFQKDGGH